MLNPQSGNIFLIGPMGVGKSTIGRRLAETSRRRFVDSDAEIERRTGVEIDLIFEIEGEPGFRQREAKIIDELTALNGVVLATGGGAVLDAENRKHLAERGTVVYLKATLDVLLRRTARDHKRPLLQTGDRRERMQELLETRERLYEALADYVIDTGAQPVKTSLDEICRVLELDA